MDSVEWPNPHPKPILGNPELFDNGPCSFPGPEGLFRLTHRGSHKEMNKNTLKIGCTCGQVSWGLQALLHSQQTNCGSCCSRNPQCPPPTVQHPSIPIANGICRQFPKLRKKIPNFHKRKIFNHHFRWRQLPKSAFNCCIFWVGLILQFRLQIAKKSLGNSGRASVNWLFWGRFGRLWEIMVFLGIKPPWTPGKFEKETENSKRTPCKAPVAAGPPSWGGGDMVWQAPT